jgi:hypothetical protein
MATLRQRGSGLPLLLAVLTFTFVSAGALALSSVSTERHRQRATERTLAQAREALLAYAADRPIDARVGPGYLPCPDLDDDGWAEATCGSLSGHLGQEQRLGRLPWKTLGLPDVQCHFHALEPEDVAQLLYDTALYVFEHVDVIEDGHTVEGIPSTEQWVCHHDDALIGPDRIVLDLVPGPRHAVRR